MDLKSISISIPAYNDAKTIEEVVLKAISVVSNITADWEIIIINDGSRDKTKEVITALSLKNNRIKIFNHEKNEGFGVTLKEIFTLPGKEWIFFVPGDGQYPPEALLKLWQYRDKYDFILGLRRNRCDTLWRKLNSKIYNLAISILAGKKLQDVNSIVFLKNEIMTRVKLNSRSAFLHAELYLKALKNNYRIAEIEVEHKERKFGEGGGGKPWVIFETVLDLLRFSLGLL